MQGSLYYFEGDDSGTVRVNVSAGRAPQAASARAATPPRSTRCFSGQIAIANEWCRVLWWSDPSDDSLHVFTVPTTNIPTQPHSSTPRHIVLTYPAPACGIDVHGIVDHGRLKLTIGWCSPFAELFVSDITVVRDGADNSVSAKYVKSVVAALDVGGAKTATALSFANQGAVDTANAFLVASGSDVWSVLVNERGEANESRLYGAGSNVTAIAVSVLQRRLFVATGSPQVVRVLDLNANAKSIMDITLPGRDVLVRSLVPSPCGQAVFAIGYDTMIKSECVITLLSNGQTKRVSGLGTMTVASVAADAQGPHAAAFSWSQSPPMPRGPLETGADGTPAPTTIHCAALSKQPLLVDLTLTRTAMLVPIAEAQSALLVVSGSSPRCRVVAVTHRVDTVLMPHAVVTAFRTAQASSGRSAGDSGVFTVSSAHVEPAPRDAEPWYNAVEAGGCIANAVAEAPELLRQIIATAIARPHSVAESPAFTRLIRTAHALGQAASIPARVIAAAATHLLLVDQPGGPAAAFANHGVWLASSFRFRASLLAADLHRRLTALIFLHLAALSSSSTCSAAEAQGLEQVTKRALLHVSAAIAVLRAAGHHLEQLRRFSAAEGPIHAQLAALLLPQKPSDFDDDLRVLQLTLQYQTISSVPSAVKAVAAWTATWIVAVPVTRHFAINEIVAKHGGPGASSALVATIRAVSDAIINLNSSIVADVVELLVGSAIAEKQGWVYTLLNTVDGIVQRHRLAALIYRVFVLRELVQEAGSVAALTADHVASLYHDAETLLALVTRDDHGSHDDTFEALADLVLDSTIYLCRDATLKRDFTRALRLLQRMASVPAAAAELYVEENTVSITTTMAEHGAMRELNHALITDTTIAKGIAMCLFELAKEPKTASGDRDSRETRRLQCTSAAVTFLTSRGALGSAAKVAYEVAVGMRSAMTRGPLTLERAHSVMCMALNTLYVIPPYVPRSGAHGGDDEGAWSAGASTQRNWSAETPMQREMTTAFTPESNGIGHLSPADIPELTRRCHQLACEAKLVHTTAVNCAPWSSIESTLAPQNVKAAEDTTKELIRARLWTDALLMADLWHLDADLVLRSWVADLLESPSANGMVDAYDGRWGQILDICGARSTTGNHHHALQLLLSVCLNHAKYRETPEVLKKELLKRDTQAVLSTILSVARLPASLTEEALHIAISYCDLSLRKGNFVVAGLSGGVVSAALLDRLAALARRVRNSDDSAADLDDRRRAALLDACSKYLDIFPKYVERKN